MMIRFPDSRAAGALDERLISFVDLAPTILEWAGVGSQAWQQGTALQRNVDRQYIFAAADRFDQAPGRTKAVFDGRWKYIRNYRPDLSVLRPLPFRDALPTMQEIWRLAEEKALSEPVQRLLERRSAEELYDLSKDPYEIVDLSNSQEAEQELARLRLAMDGWLNRTGDLSAIPELQMIKSMWPELKQPRTSTPSIRIEDNEIILFSETEGASIAYTFGDEDPSKGYIYSEPIPVRGTTKIKAKAIRYGYAPSAVASQKIP